MGRRGGRGNAEASLPCGTRLRQPCRRWTLRRSAWRSEGVDDDAVCSLCEGCRRCLGNAGCARGRLNETSCWDRLSPLLVQLAFRTFSPKTCGHRTQGSAPQQWEDKALPTGTGPEYPTHPLRPGQYSRSRLYRPSPPPPRRNGLGFWGFQVFPPFPEPCSRAPAGANNCRRRRRCTCVGDEWDSSS